MRMVTASHAKAHFSRLLGDVERGETILITRHGKVIGKIEAAGEASERQRRAQLDAFEQKRRALSGSELSADEIPAARHEGHRY